MPAPDKTRVINVSIVIKALNEAEHIEMAVRSALAAVQRVGGEVILADSLSTDATVDIARCYPITIVQLRNPADRSCGVGPQLGYQVARGRYVYILDGDMEMNPDFLPIALAEMERDPGLGGVSGLIEERYACNYQFRRRTRTKSEGVAGQPRWLDMGGLYRRSALQQTGYFSDRNLHAYEEQELGLRLSYAGWNLRRLDVCSVVHYGYTESSFRLLMRRWRSRYLDGGGEMLRAALGKPYFFYVLMHQKHIVVGLVQWCGFIAGLLLLPRSSWLLLTTMAVTALLMLIRAFRVRSLADSLFGQLVWQITALAVVRGFMARPIDPANAIEYVLCQEADGSAVAAEQNQIAGSSSAISGMFQTERMLTRETR